MGYLASLATTVITHLSYYFNLMIKQFVRALTLTVTFTYASLKHRSSLDVFATIGGGSNLLGAIDLFYGSGVA